MPLSTKKVIEIIRGFNGEPFDSRDISSIISIKKKKGHEEKKSPKKVSKDISIVNDTMSFLCRIGYLIHQKKFFTVSDKFDKTGEIQISTRGGEIRIGDQTFLIRPEDLGTAHNGDTVRIELVEIRKTTLFGKVSKVISKARDVYFAVIETKTKGMIIFRLLDLPGDHYAVMDRFEGEPAAGDYATIRLTTRKLAGRILCEMIEHFESGSDSFDVDRVIMRHNLPGPHREYSEFTDIRNSVHPSELANRKDFTDLLTVTIDGEHAKDFDDAVSFNKDDHGYTLYVHIADVSAYVEKDSPLDREAAGRGTSYYLGNRVIPMLPEILSNSLCSLRPDEERLTLTAIMNYDLEGNLVRYDFTRGLIRSSRRLTYQSAHSIIENPDDSALSKMICGLYDFTQLLKKKRLSRGRIDLQVNDFELVFENDQFEDIIRSPRYKSHSLIEESMLSANEAVSRALREKKVPTLYRVHEPMSSDQLTSLKTFLKTLGVKFSEGKNLGKSIQSVVDAVAGKEYSHVINFIILRSMMQAFYGERPLGHFGLGFRDYTHFTSPIRRYPDLIVHRTLKSLIDGKEPIYSNEELTSIGLESSRLERIAQKAERDLVKIKSCRIMEGRNGERFAAVVSGVSKYGIYVTLVDTPIEGMVPLRLLTDDFYVIIEDQYSAIGRRNGKRYRLGDHVDVRLLRADIATLQIDFEFVQGNAVKAKPKKEEKTREGNQSRHFRGRGKSIRKKAFP
jgi:ribonuclease R